MLTRKLWTGDDVPALGLGCWAIGGPFFAGEQPLGWGDVDDTESIAAIHAGLDHGIRFFDTADVYGAGRSEAVLGRALAGRKDVIVATKFGNTFDSATKQMAGPDVSPAAIKRAVDASLKRLGRECIDLLQLHINELPVSEAALVFDTLEGLRRDVKIGGYGWSTDLPEAASACATRAGFVAVQHKMNVFVPAPAILAVAERTGLLAINRSPLAMGLLTGKFAAGDTLPDDDIRSSTLDWLAYFKGGRVVPAYATRLADVRDLLRTDGRSLAQGALAWLWARSPRTMPIPGFRTAAQVMENAGALAYGPLPTDVMAEIDSVIARRLEDEPGAGAPTPGYPS